MSGFLFPERRYYWYAGAYNVVVYLALLVAAFLKAAQSQRASWCGLLTIALVLYIQLGDTAIQINDYVTLPGMETSGILSDYSFWVNRSRVASAGVIMVSYFVILVP